MYPKGAIEILFEKDFDNGPLFKNQMDLVTELISNLNSKYFVAKDNKEEYAKAISRLKAYISQLLSENARRTVTEEFKYSLNYILQAKLSSMNINPSEITNEIISDLYENNRKKNYSQSNSTSKELMLTEFYSNLFEADYISVFTAREIKFEYEIGERKILLTNLLLDAFLASLIEKTALKKYRFNFPLEQMCILFWRGLHKELSKILTLEKANLIQQLNITNLNKKISASSGKKQLSDSNKSIQEIIASDILTHLSKQNIISVYHLKSPIYSTPSIALNPNARNKSSTYLLLQSTLDEENLHKLSNDEFLYWKIFVWDNLKINNSGILVEYSTSY